MVKNKPQRVKHRVTREYNTEVHITLHLKTPYSYPALPKIIKIQLSKSADSTSYPSSKSKQKVQKPPIVHTDSFQNRPLPHFSDDFAQKTRSSCKIKKDPHPLQIGPNELIRLHTTSFALLSECRQVLTMISYCPNSCHLDSSKKWNSPKFNSSS